jgi:hypothetical protein
MPIQKAKTEKQRERAGVANPKRTQDKRDRDSVRRYARKHGVSETTREAELGIATTTRLP